MNIQDPKYWNDHYVERNTPWDIGGPSPALVDYCRNNVDHRDASILIPGGGRAYEMSELRKLGFENVYLCDWSEMAIEEAKRHNPGVDDKYFLLTDFFKIEQPFDLILEQTFFCALPPERRQDYVKKAHDMLKSRNGTLAGLLFDVCFDHEGPPFGGSKKEYIDLFSGLFEIESIEWSEKSIEPRKGTERFLIAHAK